MVWRGVNKMDIKSANTSFKVEDLVNGKLSKNQFQVNYLPLWGFLDNMERKVPGGLKALELKKIFEGIYEFATIAVSLDKADNQTRIDGLNAKNLELFMECDQLKLENANLRQLLQESQFIKENS
jgi:hypothetical protein